MFSRLRLASAALMIVGTSIWPHVASATVFSGRVGVSGYIWERSEPDSSDTRHLQNTGTVSLRLARIGGENLEIATSMRGRHDKRNQGDNVHDYRVYNLYMRWKNIGKAIDLTGGRHRMYWPTGTVSIDGGSGEARIWHGLSVAAYVGTMAPYDGVFEPTDWDEGHDFGGRVNYSSRSLGHIAFAYAERHRQSIYDELEINDLASRRIGIDWRKPVRNIGTFYGLLLYDEPTRRIGRAHLSARVRVSPKISVHGQMRFRRPNIDYNSVLWVFGDSRYYDGRLRVHVQINPMWSIIAGGTYVDLTEGDATRYDLGVAHRYFTAMIHGKSGEPGSTFGISGEATYPINAKWLVRGGTHYSSYDLIESQTESNTAVSTWAGVKWQWHPASTVELEAQWLSQDIVTQTSFAGDESDFRLIARASWWFFNRLGEQ